VKRTTDAKTIKKLAAVTRERDVTQRRLHDVLGSYDGLVGYTQRLQELRRQGGAR
jgi:hypothetical protein